MSIKFANVSFSYPGNQVFKNFDFEFPKKGLFIILGRSGCGKTTFLSLISGALVPQEGKIEGNDKSLISMVYQSSLLLNYLSVEDNVSFPLWLNGKDDKEIDLKVSEALETVSMLEFIDRDVVSLSGGEKMRVSLARALVQNREIIILDEPCGQLDEKNTKAVYEVMKRLAKDHLLIVVTHDEANAFEIADYVYEMIDGTLHKRKGTSEDEVFDIKKERSGNNSKIISLRKSLYLQKQFLKKRKCRLIMSCAFFAFNLMLIFLGLSLKEDIGTFMYSLTKEHYSYETVKIQEISTIAEEGHLSLKQYSIPDDDKRNKLDIDAFYPSLSYFLPESNTITVNNRTETCSFLPTMLQDKSRLYKGDIIRNYNEIIVNQSFLKEYSLSLDDVLSRKIVFRNQVILECEGYQAKELINISYVFRIVGVSNEKKFMNKAIAYYDYFSMYQFLADTRLDKFSNESKTDVYLSDLFDIETYGEEDFLSHEAYFIVNDLEKLDKSDSNIKYVSNALSIQDTTIEMASSLMSIVLIFLLMNLFVALLSEALIIFSLYDDNIRMFALLMIFNNGKRCKRKMIFSMSLIFTLLSFVMLVLLTLLSLFFINLILNLFSYPKLFLSIRFSWMLLFGMAILLISFLIASLSLKRIKSENIKKELEGDD